MARYKVVMGSRSQGKQAEFMLIGDTIEDALAGCSVKIYLMQRTIVKEDDKGEKYPRPFSFDKRILVKQVNVGEPIEELPF